MQTFEDLVAVANKKGWRVSSLHQWSDGRWRCNLQRWENGASTSTFTEYEDGDSPSQALSRTIKNIDGRLLGSEVRGTPIVKILKADANKAPAVVSKLSQSQEVVLSVLLAKTTLLVKAYGRTGSDDGTDDL